MEHWRGNGAGRRPAQFASKEIMKLRLRMEHSSSEHTATQSNETGEETGQVKLNSYRKSPREICKFPFISRAAISFGCSEGRAKYANKCNRLVSRALIGEITVGNETTVAKTRIRCRRRLTATGKIVCTRSANFFHLPNKAR